MAGMVVDPEKLREAIRQLNQERVLLEGMASKAEAGMNPGELVANDPVTQRVRAAIKKKDGEFAHAVRDLAGYLGEKVRAYEEALVRQENTDATAMPRNAPVTQA